MLQEVHDLSFFLLVQEGYDLSGLHNIVVNYL